MLKMKQYVGNKRKGGNAAKSIEVQEEYQIVEAGRFLELGEDPKRRYWKRTWIDEINNELWNRNMRLRYPNEDKKKRIKNKTLMEYTVEYVE